MNNVNALKAVVTGIMSFLSSILGVLYIPVLLMVACNIIDYATGLMAAKYRPDGGISSYKSIRGIQKKVTMWLLVVVGAIVDQLLKYASGALGFHVPITFLVACFVAIWIICNELISILENMIDIGVSVPKFLMPIVKNIKKQLAGIVYLIGAGPGDPGLITVKGKEILKKADCVIYDRLIPQELLDETKEGCEHIYVGKENHHHTMKQEQINELLAQKALQYDIVVRLKGGDPFVFGRGGEEAIYLANHGIYCEVVPGISSCIAAAELAGIPVTHRGISKGFRVVTAHDRRNQLSDLNFASMAKSEETLVFLMGLSKLEEITTNLLKNGMDANTPVAVVSSAASTKQQTCEATLNTIHEKVKQEKLSSPAVIVVGEVVKLQKQIQKPEDTTCHLVTKIGDQPSKLAQILKDHGYKVKELQTGEISYRYDRISKEELAKVTYLIFTSRYGVHGFMKQMKSSNLDLRDLFDKKIVVVGKKTKDVLMQYGIIADLMPEEAGEINLSELMKQEVDAKDVVWYCKGISGGEKLKKALTPICQVTEKVMYENNRKILSEIPEMKDIRSVSFTCASSARRFFDQIGEEKQQWIENIPCISIGEKTTKQLREIGVRHILESKDTTYVSMFYKIKESML